MPKSKHAAFDRKWANPLEFDYYTNGVDDATVARWLKVCKRQARRYRNREVPIPWWTVKVLRLRLLEGAHVYKEVTGQNGKPTLVAVRSSRNVPAVIPFTTELEPAQAAA